MTLPNDSKTCETNDDVPMASVRKAKPTITPAYPIRGKIHILLYESSVEAEECIRETSIDKLGFAMSLAPR